MFCRTDYDAVKNEEKKFPLAYLLSTSLENSSTAKKFMHSTLPRSSVMAGFTYAHVDNRKRRGRQYFREEIVVRWADIQARHTNLHLFAFHIRVMYFAETPWKSFPQIIQITSVNTYSPIISRAC